MRKLISIVGPTATGKTDFAFQVAQNLTEKFSSIEIISADSRQVYKGMEVGTGVDLPMTLPSGVHFFGTSLIKPNEEWSVAHFRKYAQQILEFAWKKNALPILVGGTGLYHRQVLSRDLQLTIQPSESIRKEAEQKNVTELQSWLQGLSAQKLVQMNNSDKNNPRRLVRAIEIASSSQKILDTQNLEKIPQLNIGLMAPIEFLKIKIQHRIENRLESGMIEEVEKLIANYTEKEWAEPAFSATGYKEVRAYIEDKITKEQMLDVWLRREVQYAKRQMTWWKKEKDVEWFDVTLSDWQKKAEERTNQFVDEER